LKVKELTTGNANNNSTVDNDRTTVYYATAVDMNTPAGQYKTTITYTALGVEIPPVVELACVSGLKFKGNVGTMSDLNTTRLANVGDTGIATDIRNNQQYCVGKLADNNIWMLDNLKLELGVTNVDPILDTTTLEPANSNIATSTPIDFAWSSFTSGTAAYSGSFVTDGYLTRDGTSDATRSNLDAWRQVDPSINAYCNGTNNDSQGYGKITDIGSLTNCGYLYNFYTATAGTAPQSQTTNGSLASGSICPANWQLPSGRNSSGDFGILDADYGGIGSTHSLNKPDTQGLWLPNGAFRGVFSGYWSSGLSNQGSAGRFWSRSVYSVAVAWYMGFSAGSVYPGDGYLNRLNGFSVRCLLQS
jgi:uncharacterized protein (TIGR02145 family)